ncbi:hypothetical protein HPP92_012133 [Vanilla planifolia]|uniref:Uncharacterized protein n=1 Tax=Vanilla planifolia TaxID=51239 RepID=A0A835R895_VANPL|nr:hypothetical protein HPP92_012133 [Vanilla planifolia]
MGLSMCRWCFVRSKDIRNGPKKMTIHAIIHVRSGNVDELDIPVGSAVLHHWGVKSQRQDGCWCSAVVVEGTVDRWSYEKRHKNPCHQNEAEQQANQFLIKQATGQE